MTKTNREIAIAYWIGYVVFICIFLYHDTIDEYRASEKAKAVVVDRLTGINLKGRYYYYPS
jgi:hypothetical protein